VGATVQINREDAKKEKSKSVGFLFSSRQFFPERVIARALLRVLRASVVNHPGRSAPPW
jgi:hypothetical protein